MVSGRTAFNLIEKDQCKITINGVTYNSMTEYKKMLADKKKAAAKAEREKAKAEGRKIVKPKKAKKEEKEIGIVAQKVQELMKTMPTLKSIRVYRDHAYRSWGTIANEILAHRSISKPMASYCCQFSELNELIDQIEMLAKRNEKAAYQYVEKIIWKLDDMRICITAITKAVNESGVCVRYRDHEAINGKGRQLGLATVVKKCHKTLTQMESVAKELEEIVKKGTDPFLYGTHLSMRSRSRVWA